MGAKVWVSLYADGVGGWHCGLSGEGPDDGDATNRLAVKEIEFDEGDGLLCTIGRPKQAA